MTIAMLLHRSVAHDSRVLREADALAEAGHRVTIVHQPSGPSAPEELASGVRLVPARRGGAPRRLPLALHRVILAVALIRRCLAERPDAVHAHDLAMLGPGWVASRLRRASLVYDSHELATGVAWRTRGWSLLVRAVERLLIRSADAVITVSDGIAERLRERYRLARRPTVVRNACDLPPPREGAAPDLRRRIGAAAQPLILHQGALGPGRGAEILVAALGRLDRGSLVFIGAVGADGEGPAAAELRRLAAELGLAERVHLLPPAPLESLLSNTAQADVGVSLLQDTCENHRLALPNKVFEYLAAGTPVVASRLPELEALLAQTGAGLAADPADPDAVAAAIQEVLAHRKGFRTRAEEAGRRLSWRNERRRLVELYDGLGTEAAPAGAPTAVVLVRNTASHDARILRVARSLQTEGERVAVLAVTSSERPPREEELDGVPIMRLSPRRPFESLRARRGPAVSPGAGEPSPGSPQGRRGRAASRLGRLLRTLSYYRRGISTLRRWRPRLVHCNDYNTMWIGVAAKLLWGAAIVYDSHELWPDRNARPEARWWLLASEALFVRVADEVLTTSPGHAEAIASRYRRSPPAVVRNLPDESPNGDRPPQPVGKSFVYIGGIMPGRGLEQAIDALPGAPGVRLVAIGPGREPNRRALREQAQRRGVADRFELRPPMPPGEVVARIAGHTAGLALIQPICRSYELALPNKLFEYLAAGLPVLASDLAVLGPFIRETGTGLVVPPGDLDAIADAMLELTDPDRGEQLRLAVAEARRGLSWERERAGLAAVHRSALAGAGA